jgi:hypothetical protein
MSSQFVGGKPLLPPLWSKQYIFSVFKAILYALLQTIAHDAGWEKGTAAASPYGIGRHAEDERYGGVRRQEHPDAA